jgi:amino acid adenylation domain-containing protein
MEDLQKRIGELSPAKRALLERRLNQSASQTIKPRANPSSATASFAQQRLWFLDRLEENRALYNVPRALRLIGRLDVEALAGTLNELVARHEPFRTHFEMVDGTLRQIISDKADIGLTHIDLRDVAGQEREARAKELVRNEALRPFDLRRGPVIRATLVRIDEQDHIFLLTTHHIVSDAWSAGILFQELSDVYNAFANGDRSPLRPLAIQYADFAEWQRRWLQGDVLDRQLSYWRNKLDGVTGVLELPTDYPREGGQKAQGDRRVRTLPKDLSGELIELSKREGVTLFMTLLAAFQILLWRHSGQEDIVVGSPIAGRNREEIEHLIGFFINTLALRTNLSGNPTFIQLLKQVKQTALEAYTHQDLPFEKLVEELQPERDLGRNPLFQVMFQFQNTSPARLRMKDLTVSKIETATGTAKFDLMLATAENDGVVECVIEYNTGLFADQTIDRLLKQYATLLKGIVRNPKERIASLPLMTENERRQILVDWNNTRAPFPNDQCIHQAFEQQATRSPNEIAVVFGNERATYGELNARANRLAHYLRRHNVGPEVRVAICVERSLDMMVGLLGILKAGGAYVPLEPNFPIDRISFILADCQAPLLLTQRHLTDLFTDSHVKAVYLDDERSEFTNESSENPLPLTSAENSAHVIYTSGSTGQPKGVVSAHRSSLNRFAWMWRTYPFALDEVCCQKTSLSFVDAIWEIFGPLLQGVPLVIIPDDAVKDPRQFVAALSSNRVTRLVLVPSLLRVMLEIDQDISRRLEHLRYCICSGETLPVELASLFRQKLPNAQLINLYGSSEVAADVTCYEVDHADKLSTIPIGRPIANTQVYILDTAAQPVPIGMSGEICIGGEGLALGYLNQPDLTAEKFLPTGFSSTPGARLFRTGDLGQYRADGIIEYRGRRDHQIKLRGFRVELGEIEAHLRSHPSINQAVVVASDDERGEKQLVAYVSFAEAEATNSELREHLQRNLPGYMIPSVFVVLESFPLTASGKINRLALPSPDHAQLATRADIVEPRTATEKTLASIWTDLLKVENVGVFDDFFALGGHSLLLVQVASRLRESFQVDLPLRSLFEASTLADLAERVEAARTTETTAEQPFVVVSRDGELPLSFSQERLWVLEQLEPNTAAYNIPRVLRMQGPLNRPALKESMEAIVARHEVLRSFFVNQGGQPSLSIAETPGVDIPVSDLSALTADQQSAKIKELVTAETRRPFDLSAAPLFRLALLRVHDREHILIMTIHHIVCDAWSLDILIRELAAHYNALTTKTRPSLPPLPMQYIDFAAWQRAALSGSSLEKQLEYWRSELTGAPSLIKLPTDRPRPAIRSFSGARFSFSIAGEIADKLKRLARAERATLFMTLLAAFQSLLTCLTNEEQIVVGSPVAGRNRPGCEQLIGYFINTLVIRSDSSGDPTFRESVRRTRVKALAAFANQDVPFEKLVEELNPPRTAAYNPLFQVWFVLQPAFIERAEFNALAIEYLESDSGLTRHDLQLSLWENVNGLTGALTYSTALFDAETIACMAEQFKTLVAIVAEEPDTRLSMLLRAVAGAAVAYRAEASARLAEMTHRKLKSTKRKTVTDRVSTAAEKS